ncbi:MAG: hypothetical protein KJ936_02280, partial [Proteobacteria bacterium]|nr:hypothetical protein [Pseudomonadota bacterium]
VLFPPPLAPSCLPQQVGEGKRKKVIIALLPGEGKFHFFTKPSRLPAECRPSPGRGGRDNKGG